MNKNATRNYFKNALAMASSRDAEFYRADPELNPTATHVNMDLIRCIVLQLAVLLAALSALQAYAFEDGIEQFGSDINGVRHVSASEAAKILKNYPTVKVLDVRTGIEFRLGHISDAINVNYYSLRFRERLEKLDKNITWLVHCRTGVRSGKSVPIMQSLGFRSIVHLDGGTSAWKKDGLPLTKN